MPYYYLKFILKFEEVTYLFHILLPILCENVLEIYRTGYMLNQCQR